MTDNAELEPIINDRGSWPTAADVDRELQHHLREVLRLLHVDLRTRTCATRRGAGRSR
jgi:hypothetical protein